MLCLIARHADQFMPMQNVFLNIMPVPLLLMKVTLFMFLRSMCVSVGLFSHKRCSLFFVVAFLVLMLKSRGSHYSSGQGGNCCVANLEALLYSDPPVLWKGKLCSQKVARLLFFLSVFLSSNIFFFFSLSLSQSSILILGWFCCLLQHLCIVSVVKI